MNESEFNFTSYDIKDELNNQDQGELSFLSKISSSQKKTGSYQHNFQLNDTISIIKENTTKDQANLFTSIVENENNINHSNIIQSEENNIEKTCNKIKANEAEKGTKNKINNYSNIDFLVKSNNNAIALSNNQIKDNKEIDYLIKEERNDLETKILKNKVKNNVTVKKIFEPNPNNDKKSRKSSMNNLQMEKKISMIPKKITTKSISNNNGQTVLKRHRTEKDFKGVKNSIKDSIPNNKQIKSITKTKESLKSISEAGKKLVKSKSIQTLKGKPDVSNASTKKIRASFNNKASDSTSSKGFTKVNQIFSATSPTTQPAKEISKISFPELFSDKINDLFNSELQNNIQAYFLKIKELQTVTEKEIENNQEEILNFIESLYDDKIKNIIEVNEKYEYDIHKLKELVNLDDPNNINNKIYQAVVDDRAEEIKEIEEEFLVKKQAGISKLRQKLREKKEDIILTAETKSEEIKKELSNFLREKIFVTINPNDELKNVDLSCIDLEPKIKKVDFNSTIDTTLFNKTMMPAKIGLSKKIKKTLC